MSETRMIDPDYRKLMIGGECFAVYPVNATICSDLFRTYPLRGGRIVRQALRWSHFLHCDYLFLRRHLEFPLGAYGITQNTLEQLMERAGLRSQTFCFFYPSPVRSRDRIYCYALDRVGNIIAYIKICRGIDRMALKREYSAVKLLDRMNGLMFRYPRCVVHQMLSDVCDGAVFEVLPSDAEALQFSERIWDEEIGAIARSFRSDRRILSRDEMKDEPWFEAFVERGKTWKNFYYEFMDGLDSGIEVSRIHGDFAGHNFRRASGRIWVLDWEEMTEKGPVLADEVCFFLSTRRFDLGWSMEKVGSAFRRLYLETPFRTTAIQAVAYLYGRKISMGREIIEFLEQF